MNKVSFIDTLAKAITSPSVALHDFLLELNLQNKIVHAFFEGKTDESFYGSFIRNVKDTKYDIKTYVCGNNDGVYYQFDKLSNRNMGNNILVYFTDKDIEDIIPFPRKADSHIYVTDYYSIENYIVNSEILEQVLAEIFKLRSGNKASKLILDKLTACINNFNSLMLTVMAWVLYHKRNIENKNVTINLGCILMKKIYKINDDLDFELIIEDDDDIIRQLDIHTKCNTDFVLWHKYKECLIKELMTHPPKHYVRGHNEMEFFIYFINMVKNALSKAQMKALKMSVDLTESNSIDLLGPRVQIPKSLENFLYKNLKPQMSLSI
jgi:hypothetical protein